MDKTKLATNVDVHVLMLPDGMINRILHQCRQFFVDNACNAIQHFDFDLARHCIYYADDFTKKIHAYNNPPPPALEPTPVTE